MTEEMHDDNRGRRAALGALAEAKSRGRLLVPINDAISGGEGLDLRFVRVDSPDPVNRSSRTDFVPVFTSEQALLDSGLPPGTRYVSPSPIELGRLLGPDQWIAIDPGGDMTATRMHQLEEMWAAIVEHNQASDDA